MDYLNDLLERKNMSQLVLACLFILYLIMGRQTPQSVSMLFNNIVGQMITIGIALYLFAYYNPILGALALLVAYQLITMSSSYEGLSLDNLKGYLPTQEKVWSPYSPAHQFPSYTLEQEIVKKMASQKFNTTYVKAPYRPSLDDTHNASPLQ